MARQIGTYELSILPYEDCCTLFVPKSPATNPNLRIIESAEASLTQLTEEIEKAVQGTETLCIRPDQDIDRSTGEEQVVQDKWF